MSQANPEEPYGANRVPQTEDEGIQIYTPAEVRRMVSVTNDSSLRFFRIIAVVLGVIALLTSGCVIALGIYAASVEECTYSRCSDLVNLPSTWRKIEPSGAQPHARLSHAATSDGEYKMYIHGGFYGFNDTIFNDLWVYDEREDKWTQITTSGDIPSPRIHHSLVMVDGSTMLLFGGFNVFNTNPLHDSYDDLYQLNLRNLVWTRLNVAGLKPSKRGAHDCFYADGAMFMFGGFEKIGPTGHFEQLWKYVVSENRWYNLTPTDLANFPDGRIGFAMVPYDASNAMLYGGGCPPTSPESEGGQCDDVWLYNWQTNVWTRKLQSNAPPARRATHGDVAFFGLIYLFGGVDIRPVNGTPVTKMLNDLWVYDPAADFWMPVYPNFNRGVKPPVTFGHSVVALGTKMVVFGGRAGSPTSPGTNQLYEYHVIPPVV